MKWIRQKKLTLDKKSSIQEDVGVLKNLSTLGMQEKKKISYISWYSMLECQEVNKIFVCSSKY